MEPLKILTDPTPSLRKPSRLLTVEEIQTPEFQRFLDQLLFTMEHANGVGIAAPQVGKNVRAMFVTTSRGPECFINPTITKASPAMTESEEGCLSVPGTYGIVMRHKKVFVEALNRHGRTVAFEVKRFPAIEFQHEIDHLDGILFIDKAIRLTSTGNTF